MSLAEPDHSMVPCFKISSTVWSKEVSPLSISSNAGEVSLFHQKNLQPSVLSQISSPKQNPY